MSSNLSPNLRQRAPLLLAARASAGAASAALHGKYPERYHDNRMLTHIERLLEPGMQILDVGAGARPTIDPAIRPAGCHYVGHDVSLSELERARADSYDELTVSPIEQFDPDLAQRFDLVISLFALEHVRSLSRAMANMHSYLRPGGWLIAALSGRFAYFAVANAVLPWRARIWLGSRLLDRSPDSMFPTRYDRAWYDALCAMRSPQWSEWRVEPQFSGAHNLRFVRPLQSLYLAYEEWLVRRGHPNLATDYLIVASRAA